jgi:hypothetical protein
MQVKTCVKAGKQSVNHNEALVRRAGEVSDWRQGR